MKINVVMITDTFEWNYSILFCVFSLLNFVFAFFLPSNFILERNDLDALFQTPALMRKTQEVAAHMDISKVNEQI